MSGAHRRKRSSKDHVKWDSQRHRDGSHNTAGEEAAAAAQEGFPSRLSPAISFYILILTALLVLSGLFWSFNQQSAPPLQPSASGASNSSVYDRGLVSSRVSYHSVQSEHMRYWSDVSHRHLQSSVLAYVTPWNGKGYDMAKRFRAKFTHVSPVWYQLRRGRESQGLHGRHDVDQKWMKDVRHEGSPLIVPRVVVEGWPLDMLIKRDEREKAVRLLANEIIEMEFDGIVLEAWSVWRSHRILEDSTLRKKALDFVKVLGQDLHSMKGTHLYSGGPPQLIFVIPPPGNPKDPASFTSSDMTYLSDAVDGFSLMTYDFSSPYSPGPNAPLSWVQQCLQLLFPGGSKDIEAKSDRRAKLLLGVNFYGNDYIVPQGGGPILGAEYVSIITQHKPQITWDDASQEHYLEYREGESKQKRNRRVYYPSLKSLAARFKEAEAWGVGISIWEIGQGLDYFFDLL